MWSISAGVRLTSGSTSGVIGRAGQNAVGRNRRALAAWFARPQTIGEFGDAGRFEHPAHRHRHTQRLAQARDQLGGQQRMPTQFEEVVVNAGRRLLQHRAPDTDQDFLERVARACTPACADPCGSGSGSALRSTLPLGVSGSARSNTQAAGTM